MMSCFRHDWLEGWDHSILINRLDTSWSLSLCPLYMTPNLGCATSCLISHFVALRLTVSGSDWGDPLGISLRKACLMDETSSHLQSFLTTPVSSLSHTRSTLLLTYNNSHVVYCVDSERQRFKKMKLYTVVSTLTAQFNLEPKLVTGETTLVKIKEVLYSKTSLVKAWFPF